MKQLILTIFSLQLYYMSPAQRTIPLYQKEIPNSKSSATREHSDKDKEGRISISKVVVPILTLYLPSKEKATGTAVIICPGGGYSSLTMSYEGEDVARALNEWGVAALVLKYRLPDADIMVEKEMGPLQDAQRALQLTRENAKAWGIHPHQVGIMGFSAGGHLASTAGTHFNSAYIENKQGISLRPDFMILLYPVISFADSLAHQGSKECLLGKFPTNKIVRLYSNELQVTTKTPPAFLVHAKDDSTVLVKNSILFYEALLKNKVPAVIHLFEKGGHGFGMQNNSSNDKWMDWLKEWMQQHGWLQPF